MIIKTNRLTLVPLSMEHLQTAYAYSSDPVLTKYMMFLPVDSIEETRRFIEDSQMELLKETPGYYEFAVLLGEEHIGSVNLYFDTAPDLGELGWLFLPEYQGQGLGTEALRQLESYYPAATRFRLEVEPDNLSAARLYQRLGFEVLEYRQFVKDRF